MGEPSETPESLATQIESMLGQARIPGCSIALVDRQGLRWAAGFGLADPRARRPAGPDTVYHLFSGTKLFTATAVMKLVEDGALTLDEPVTRSLPELEQAGGITVEQLLSHQSGLPDTLKAFLAVTFPPARPLSALEALAAYEVVPRRPPGRVEYRNVNYAILGAIISRVSGKEYRDYVVEHVLAPLGMDVAFSLTESMRPHAATGTIGRWDPMRLVLRVLMPRVAAELYRGREGGLMLLRDFDLATAAIGGLVGSVTEFARFATAQLDGGGGVLGRESTLRMQSQIVPGAAGIESREGVGLGWKQGRVGERHFINHEGGGAGFTSEIRLYPDAGVGMVIGMNAMRMPATMHVAHRMCEAVFAQRERLSS